MKKIINGKRYDTDTAKLMGSDSYSNPRDFHHWVEELYRKTTGEFFLYGAGGPATKYAQAVGQNEWSGGERIMPLSVEDAKEWVEKHLTADDYETIFGEIAEDEDVAKTSWAVKVTPATIERIKRAAGERGMQISEIVEAAIATYLS